MGIKPLLPYLAKIDKVKSVKDLQQLLIEMEPIGGIGFIGVGVELMIKIVPKLIKLGVGRLGLPDQDYYISEEIPKKKEINTKNISLECSIY
jgi:endothelin-converting enzyme/putative endopeptidase